MRIRRAVVAGAIVLSLAGVAGPSAAVAKTRSADYYFLSTGPSWRSYVDTRHRNVSETFTLVNGNGRNVFVHKIGANMPGLLLVVPSGSGTGKLVAPSGPGLTMTVPPHGSIQLTVWFHVSDCAKVPKGSLPLTMGVGWRPGNWHRVDLTMPGDPSMPWPRTITDSLCT